MADENRNKCQMKNCSCSATGDSKYCSAACETAANDDVTTIACECGHSGCSGAIS